MIVVIDYGIGNLRSVSVALRRAGAEVRVSDDRAEIERADKLVFPGVGSLAAGMGTLREKGLLPVLERKVLDQRTPVLGICLGFQLFSRHSEEGNVQGLGWIDADTRRLTPPADDPLPVPHLGWNRVDFHRHDPLWTNVASGSHFYFAHSYHVACGRAEQQLAGCRYGQAFTAALRCENIYGVQFHPEKSHAVGAQVIRNFVDLAA